MSPDVGLATAKVARRATRARAEKLFILKVCIRNLFGRSEALSAFRVVEREGNYLCEFDKVGKF